MGRTQIFKQISRNAHAEQETASGCVRKTHCRVVSDTVSVLYVWPSTSALMVTVHRYQLLILSFGCCGRPDMKHISPHPIAIQPAYSCIASTSCGLRSPQHEHEGRWSDWGIRFQYPRWEMASTGPVIGARRCRTYQILYIYASVPADQSSLADPVKGGELSYMALAMERESTAYRSLPIVARTVLTDPEPMLARLVRGCIALAFNASVLADQSSHSLADPVKGGEGRAQLHGAGDGTRVNCVSQRASRWTVKVT